MDHINGNTFQMIIDDIEKNIDRPIPQPILVIGKSGAGKTSLLQDVLDYTNNKGIETVRIDGKNVFESTDIINNSRLSHQRLILLDNMDYYFKRSSYEDQFNLRKYLYNEGAPMLVATMEKIADALTDYRAPFFEGFKVLYLNELSLTESLNKYFSAGGRQRADKLLRLLPGTIGSVNLVQNILKQNEDSENDLKILLNLFHCQYKNLYFSLPNYSQKILNAISGNEEPLVLAEIMKATGLPTSTLSVYLKNLTKQSILISDRQKRKHTKYSIADPLYKLWLRTSN